ncbi:MAG: hypothetical protein K9N07_10170 [Candidatus Cloacimonetes bacterium]|nr:hypothetical protein [Candidatus Cloacimonadota bacterium]
MDNLLFPGFITFILFLMTIAVYVFEFFNKEKETLIKFLLQKLKNGIILFLILEMFYFSFAVTPIFSNSLFAKDRLLSFCGMIFFIYCYFVLQIPKKKDEPAKKQETQIQENKPKESA